MLYIISYDSYVEIWKPIDSQLLRMENGDEQSSLGYYNDELSSMKVLNGKFLYLDRFT